MGIVCFFISRHEAYLGVGPHFGCLLRPLEESVMGLGFRVQGLGFILPYTLRTDDSAGSVSA